MKHLKLLALFLIILSASPLWSAANFKGLGLNLTGPDQRWIASPVKVSSVKEGWVYNQNFTRYIFEVKNPYELGNISYFSMPFTIKTKDLNSVTEIQSAFTKMFDINPFVLTQYKGNSNQWMLEGEYQKHGRFVRMLITKHKNRFSVSLAYLRKPYLESTDYSSAWIQERLAQREDQLIEKVLDKKTSSIFSFMSDAYAQSGTPAGWSNKGGFITPPKSAKGTFDPITLVKKDGSTVTVQPCPGPSPLPTTRPPVVCPSPNTCPAPSPLTAVAYQACVQSISNCRLGQVGDSAAAIPGKVDDVRGDLKCQSDWWSAKMDHQSDIWGSKADRGLDIMEKAFSPTNVAAMAAAGVIGASIASFGMSLAISGIQAGAEALWDLVSGNGAERGHQQIVKLFMENKDKWNKMNEEAMELTGTIDRSMELLEMVKLSGKSLEQIIIDNKTNKSELETKIEDAKAKYERTKAKHDFDEQNGEVCKARDEYNFLKKELIVLSGQISKLDEIKDQHGNFEAMCTTLNHNLSTLLQLEGDLQNSRMLLLKSYDHFQIEEGRRRETMRETGRELQLVDPKKALKADVTRAEKSYLAGVKTTEITKALEKAADACYYDNIKKNFWHNIICRVPILRGAPLLGGISAQKGTGAKAACMVIHSNCQGMEEKKNYLYRIAHTGMGDDYNTAERKELIRAHRQYTGLMGTYQSDVKLARQTYDQKTKVKDYLNYNEDVAREKTEAVHNWMMSMRLEQACSNLPDTCDDQAGKIFSKIKDNKTGKTINNEYLKRVVNSGKPSLQCVCHDPSTDCNCGQINQSEYFKCMQTKTDCDANKQGLLCYNLPNCNPKMVDGKKDFSSCTEMCPKIEPNCTNSNTKVCLVQKEVAKMCADQFITCNEQEQQTGCEQHFAKKCEGSEEFCNKFTLKCREQALNRSKFRFEKLRVQSDLIKSGACKDALR
ncbi:MAG TPA: hypothetical protein VNJ08_04065 [Bacteriovoracaceae bacterium]|nr:hypothetical protein [Bacteriovoracaceae bacterium]